MGRRKYLKRKPKKQRGKQTSSKPHDSEPERPGTHYDEDQESLAWDSLDELTLPPTPSGAEYLPSPDEMEVARRFSCLNFSMLPCPDPMLALEPTHIGLEAMDASSTGVNMAVLPSLSDKEGVIGCKTNSRQSRKRPSRRKPNKRTKKVRHSLNLRETPTPSKHHTHSPQHPLYISFVRPTAKDPQFSRTKSFRRLRPSQHEEDPLLCFFSDTSVVCDAEGHVSERMDETGDFTLPTQQCCVGGVEGCEGVGGMVNESEISTSETSLSDSGCEGDDEESSVEGPLLRQNRFSPTGKISLGDSSSEDEQLSKILQGAFPLLSKEGQKELQSQLYPDLSEFKHPGRAGLSVRGGRKKRCKPAQLSNPLTLMEVNQMIVKFVRNSSESELKFSFVSRALCRTISCLAGVYKLDCFIEQKRRLPVASPLLRKSVLTRLASRHEIEPILRSHGRESPTMWIRDSRALDAIEPRPMDVVAQGIPPLGETNIGNQMLRNMGWTPGMALGLHGNGIMDPVKVDLRPRNTGLGYT